jgi:hypothetical protein
MSGDRRSQVPAETGRSRAGFPRQSLWIAVLCTVLVAQAGLWVVSDYTSYHQVRLQWRGGVPENRRASIAHRLSLHPVDTDERRWTCLLADASTTNVAAILREPAIERTEFLDAARLQPTRLERITVARWLGARFPWTRRALGDLHDVVRGTAVAPVFVLCLMAALIGLRRGREWLATRVPRMSPAALGVFRIAFAVCLWMAVRATIPENSGLRLASVVLLGLFAIGLASRLAFAGFVLVFTAAHGANVGHDLALPLKTLWLLLLVPWGAGFSLDESFRRYVRRRFTTTPSRMNGLAVWIPVLMLGLAYAAAAYAKLDELGIRWITGGAVRYIFIADRANAPVRLGRLIASSDELSVLFSAAAVAAELFVIVAAIGARPWLVAVAGAVALALQSGFYVLQGIWWHAWWALLPAFLPWQRMATACADRLPELVLIVDAAAVHGALARGLRAFDWFDRLRVDVTANGPAEFQLVRDGTIETGYRAGVSLCQVLPIAWPILPLMLIPPIARKVHVRLAAAFRRDTRRGAQHETAAPGPIPEAAVVDTPFPTLVAVALVIAVVQQPVASLLRKEYWFLVSDFPMYSNAYLAAKPEFAVYAERTWQPPPIVRFRSPAASAAADIESQLRQVDPNDVLRNAVRTVARGKTLAHEDAVAVRTVAADYVDRFPAAVGRVDAEVDTWRFDWSVVEFVPRGEWKRVASVDLASGAIGP